MPFVVVIVRVVTTWPVVLVHHVRRLDFVSRTIFIGSQGLIWVLNEIVRVISCVILVEHHPRVKLSEFEILRVSRRVDHPETFVRANALAVITFFNVAISDTTDVLVVDVRPTDKALLIIVLTNIAKSNRSAHNSCVRVIGRQVALLVNFGTVQVGLVSVD